MGLNKKNGVFGQALFIISKFYGYFFTCFKQLIAYFLQYIFFSFIIESHQRSVFLT